jgi:hypothetical protein
MVTFSHIIEKVMRERIKRCLGVVKLSLLLQDFIENAGTQQPVLILIAKYGLANFIQ